MERVKIFFADHKIEFIDRDVALKQVEKFAEEGTYPVYVIYGPEGCGKTALFKQATKILEEYGYSVVHINPLAEVVEERFSISRELKEIVKELGISLAGDVSRVIEKTIELLYTAVRRGIRKKIAILADDVFQAIGLDKAEQIVKSFLNMIEWPSIEYERIVVLVASSEGVTRERIGRHTWSVFQILWNMSRDGFEELYNVLPDPKPLFEDIWRLSGGNPRILETLYKRGWNVDIVVEDLIAKKRLRNFIYMLSNIEKEILREALENPDTLLYRARDAPKLLDRVIELNLVIELNKRLSELWIDTPPPDKDLELGIGRYIAWQTPLHRKAVERVLIEEV
ncbi:ATPase [Ignisphaera aggregans DSM 17230]|uniref:ATPase n=1 Tax=Ignisphaera aggregans (strain DSM 17230 / JCM 13409 / AQ1.S1) TaxID=583356 RepID=E0SPQ4_IGNAA|nr:ATPase [Ignisphaera aggregans DSM 17230]